MSLAALCGISTATIQRVTVTQTAAMGQQRDYSTGARGSLPTTSTGRLNQNSASRRSAYGERDVEIDAIWYTVTNPQCDNRDLILIGSNKYFVHAQRNPDLVGKFYSLELRNFSRGLQ